MTDWPILSTVTFLPLVGVALLLLTRGDTSLGRRNILNVSLLTTVFTFVVSLFIWIGFDNSNPGFQMVETHAWVSEAIKFKLGGGDLAHDLATVRAVRTIVGEGVALMVDYNQSLEPVEAIRRVRALEPFGLEWVEEPVAAEDLQGHARVRAATRVPIQTGENWWFPRAAEQALSAGACDRMMPDLMKIGGITGWLSVMGLARAASMPVSSHLFIEASAHVLAVTPTCDWLEFMDFGSPVLQEPCVPVNGAVTARGPGLGMTWNEDVVARCLVA